MPERWSNWAGNRTCECEIAEPRTRDELSGAVRRASEAGHRVRAVGGGYSWSPLVPTDGTIVSLAGLRKEIRFDEKERTVEIEGGMTIEALNALVEARDFTLVSPTLFPRPTVGGAMGTGSHGTGSSAGNFTDCIREITLVGPDGTLETLGRDHADFCAAKVALGSLGIVYSVKLEIVPQFRVYVDKRSVPMHYVLDEFDDLQKSYEFLEIFWFPLQKKMWLYMMDRTDSRPDRRTWRTRLRGRFDTWLENRAAGNWIPRIARHAPRFTPVLNRLASALTNQVEVEVQTASDAFHFQKAYPKNWDLSYAVPATDAARAWSEAVALVNEYARAELYPVNLALHCRFTGPSDAWLAPDHGRPTCYVEVTTAQGTPRWEGFFRDMESRWFAIPGARPHWGKLYWRTRELAARYPRMADFLAVRDRRDPDRVFLNDFLENELFQLPARPQPPARPRPSAPPPSPGPTPTTKNP